MSVVVAIEELGAALADRPWGYLITVTDDGTSRLLAVDTAWREGQLHMPTGQGTRANAAARPNVTMVFPPIEPGGYSLIVDGRATAIDDGLSVEPVAAVLHRPAPGQVVDQTRSSSPNP